MKPTADQDNYVFVNQGEKTHKAVTVKYYNCETVWDYNIMKFTLILIRVNKSEINHISGFNQFLISTPRYFLDFALRLKRNVVKIHYYICESELM